jgi:hypothetical protein
MINPDPRKVRTSAYVKGTGFSPYIHPTRNVKGFSPRGTVSNFVSSLCNPGFNRAAALLPSARLNSPAL